jgi:multidrug resistance efflux pump
MELEIFEAFRAAGVPDDKARGAVEAISDLIDRRYALHAEQLATRADVAELRTDLERFRSELSAGIAGTNAEISSVRGELAASIAGVRTEIAEAKSELIRWSVGSIFASVGMFAAIMRVLAN